MLPASPPFPICSNFPFHCAAGSHTSKVICESEVGLISPRTRQKAGTSTAGAGIPGGSAKGPAATFSADVMEVSGNCKSLSFSQTGFACARAEAAITETASRETPSPRYSNLSLQLHENRDQRMHLNLKC